MVGYGRIQALKCGSAENRRDKKGNHLRPLEATVTAGHG
ncbi:hypothetical protein A2U01_0032188, partial [Trifolium medium]|nr:hypothetical protein [Trifolium medium]